MVVEANRDAALECVKRAGKALMQSDILKMRSLLAKAKKLDPDCDVNSILRANIIKATTVNNSAFGNDSTSDRSYSHDDHYDDTSDLGNLKNRRKASEHSRSRNGEREQPSTSETGFNRGKSRSRSASRRSVPIFRNSAPTAEYTKEEMEMVQRIRQCKDYYEILQVSRDCTEVQLKRQYRDIARKLHPDKCKVPGSTEAFKALGNAYGVLSDKKKRDEYDRFGPDNERQTASHHRHSEFYEYDVGRGFESELSAEDIFDMLFGGGFARMGPTRRRAAGQAYQRAQYAEERAQAQETSPFYQLIQILPIIVLIFGGLLMQLFVSEPPYSLTRDSTYYVQRFTKDLRVTYFVKPDFETNYGRRLRSVEQHVEDDYLSMLRTNCYREKNHRENLLWTAKLRGDETLWRQAQEKEMPYCRRLEELYR